MKVIERILIFTLSIAATVYLGTQASQYVIGVFHQMTSALAR